MLWVMPARGVVRHRPVDAAVARAREETRTVSPAGGQGVAARPAPRGAIQADGAATGARPFGEHRPAEHAPAQHGAWGPARRPAGGPAAAARPTRSGRGLRHHRRITLSLLWVAIAGLSPEFLRSVLEQQQPDMFDEGMTFRRCGARSFTYAGAFIVWCLVALVLAGFAMARRDWARRGLM